MGLWNSYKKLWTKPLAKLRGDGGTPVHVDASTFPVKIVTAENGACECDDCEECGERRCRSQFLTNAKTRYPRLLVKSRGAHFVP